MNKDENGWYKVPFIQVLKQGNTLTTINFLFEDGNCILTLPSNDIYFTDTLFEVCVEPILAESRGLDKCLSRLQPHNVTQTQLKY